MRTGSRKATERLRPARAFRSAFDWPADCAAVRANNSRALVLWNVDRVRILPVLDALADAHGKGHAVKADITFREVDGRVHVARMTEVGTKEVGNRF